MRHIEDMHVTLSVGRRERSYTLPLSARRELEEVIRRHSDEGSVPAEVVFPDLLDDEKRPATMLRGSRYKMGMTQKQLAAVLDVKQHHLSEMENAKRPIGKAMARKLAEALRCHYRVFL